jgi:endonuclease YncB( thermonuclease family)
LVKGKPVTLKVRDEDRYGRLVSEVILEDGHSLNQALVEAGMAWWYRSYAESNTTLSRLEREAREAGRGLWADADPEPPWQFRNRMREE